MNIDLEELKEVGMIFLRGDLTMGQIKAVYEPIKLFFKGDEEKAMLWFKTPNPLLGNITPAKMVTFGDYDKLKIFIETSLDENEAPEGVE